MSTTDSTKRALIAMLQENTGRHMLDSGGAYGRHWERNQKIPSTIKAWDARPPSYYEADIYSHGLEILVYIDLYHHLERSLTYEPAMTRGYWQFDAKHPDDTWNETMEAYCKLKGWEYEHVDFGHGYTYNEENSLNQDFVWHCIRTDHGEFVFIQIHGGCDARGGFTKPRLFSYDPDYLFSYDRYTVGCDSGHYWDYDGGLYEYTETDTELNKCDAVDYDDLEPAEQIIFDAGGVQAVPEGQIELMPEVEPRKFIPYNPNGRIIVKDHKAYCPICGHVLEAWSL